MRNTLILFPLMMCATPALAQTPSAAIHVPHELTDPATAKKLGNAMQTACTIAISPRRRMRCRRH